jgi:hypothetical protein
MILSKIYQTYHLFHFMAQIIFPNVKKYLELEFNIVDFCYIFSLEEYLV